MSDELREIDDEAFARLLGGRRVALVHDWLTGMRGGEKVLEAIAEQFPGAPIYTLFCFEDRISERLRRHPIHTSFLQDTLPRRLLERHYRQFLPFFPQAIEDFDLRGYDLVISTSHCVAKGAIPGPEAVHLSYCHSPMRYAWDQEHAYFPRRGGPIGRLRGAALTALRVWDSASTPRVDQFWANSSFVARRIRRYYGRGAEVLPPPVDVEAFASIGADAENGDAGAGDHGSEAYRIADREFPRPSPFLLAVSALVPYKRLDLAIQAAERLGIDLCIVGTGPEEKALRRVSEKYGERHGETHGGRHTRLLGRVDDETLRRLFRDARAFVQPGVEDFGIAAVEALAAGTPVVALGRGGVRDIVEDGVHGVLYDPGPGADVDPDTEVAHLAAAIDKSSRIRFNPLDSKRRARDFSRDRFVHRLRSSIARTLASGAGDGSLRTEKR